MPYKSEAQRRYFNSEEGKAKIGAEEVEHWNEVSKGKKLPEKVEDNMFKKTMDRAIKLTKTRDTSRIVAQKNGYRLAIVDKGHGDRIILMFPGETESNPHMYLGSPTPSNLASAKKMLAEFAATKDAKTGIHYITYKDIDGETVKQKIKGTPDDVNKRTRELREHDCKILKTEMFVNWKDADPNFEAAVKTAQQIARAHNYKHSAIVNALVSTGKFKGTNVAGAVTTALEKMGKAKDAEISEEVIIEAKRNGKWFPYIVTYSEYIPSYFKEVKTRGFEGVRAVNRRGKVIKSSDAKSKRMKDAEGVIEKLKSLKSNPRSDKASWVKFSNGHSYVKVGPNKFQFNTMQEHAVGGTYTAEQLVKKEGNSFTVIDRKPKRLSSKVTDMPFNNNTGYNHSQTKSKAEGLAKSIKMEGGKISTYGSALDNLVKISAARGTAQEAKEIDQIATSVKQELLNIINRF